MRDILLIFIFMCSVFLILTLTLAVEEIKELKLENEQLHNYIIEHHYRGGEFPYIF